jgi:lysylphosphatidylglycerol synthetase-like protein (DUF2156 family)
MLLFDPTALLGDKSFLFSENKNACIMFAVAGRSWVSMGDPIGPETAWFRVCASTKTNSTLCGNLAIWHRPVALPFL